MRINRFYGHSVVVDPLSETSTIIDLGANHGNFAVALADQFNCKPLCVEPDPRVFPILKSNPKISALNLAISTHTGTSRLHLTENLECSSLVIPTTSKTIAETECQTMTLEALLASTGTQHVDLVKVDMEGMELEVLPSLQPEALERIDQLTVEFHESVGMGTVKQVVKTIDYLKSFGFVVVRGSFFDYSDVLFFKPKRLGMAWSWRWAAAAQRIHNGVFRRLGLSTR
jgi:FkbM family methyltransferase